VLTDGKEKPSTNGTWLYLGEQQTIYNGMIFKANQTVFQVNFFFFFFFIGDDYLINIKNYKGKENLGFKKFF